MPDPFASMHATLADYFGGESSTIRGAPAAQPIAIAHGVAISGEYGEVVSYRSVATIAKADNPRGGDQIVVDGKTYTIDSILDNDGYDVRCVLR